MSQHNPGSNPEAGIYGAENAGPGIGSYRSGRSVNGNVWHATFLYIARGARRVWRSIREEMRRASARQQLSALSERELKDMGIARADIEAIAGGSYASDGTRCMRRRARVRSNHA